MANPQDDEEARKRITALAIAGDPLVLIDNIVGGLGSASLDVALTGTAWQDRILGKSEIVSLDLRTTWAATGNNVVLRADTCRRVLHIRLHSLLEQPESRIGFRYEDIREHTQRHRGELLSAALTILRAYFVAGCPRQKIRAWGSFEGFSGLVRQALVWVGQPDPANTRRELVEAGDRELIALRTIVECWNSVDPNGEGLTAGQIVEHLKGQSAAQAAIREAILELCPPRRAASHPTARQVGTKLSHLRGRVVGGRAVDYREARGHTRRWLIVEATQQASSDSIQVSPMSPSSGDGDVDANGDSKTSAYENQESVAENK